MVVCRPRHRGEVQSNKGGGGTRYERPDPQLDRCGAPVGERVRAVADSGRIWGVLAMAEIEVIVGQVARKMAQE